MAFADPTPGGSNESVTSIIKWVFAALLSAAALWLGTGLHPAWWLTWLAPAPVLAFALRASAASAALASFAAWAAGGSNLWQYYRTTLGLPLPVAALAITMPATVFAVGSLLARALARRGRFLLATLALPAWWAAAEHLTGRVSPHGTFGSLAYTQMDFLPVVQVASVCGATGVSFLVLLVPTALAVLAVPAAAAARRRVIVAAVAVSAAAFAYGGWRLGERRPIASLRVGAAAADRPAQPVPATSPEGRGLLGRYAAAARALSSAGAQVIVLPETTLRVPETEVSAVAERLAQPGSIVVVGLDLQGADERNVALAVAPHGAAAAIYAKRHLLSPFESRYKAGSALTLLPVGSVSAGLAVCKDLDFPRLGRDYANRGAGLLLVPAWDFEVDGWLHSRMAVLRGVEGGFAVARAARRGRLTFSDDRGRVLAETASAESETAAAFADLDAGPSRTVYSTLGDWFGWLCCALTAVAAAAALRRAPRG